MKFTIHILIAFLLIGCGQKEPSLTFESRQWDGRDAQACEWLTQNQFVHKAIGAPIRIVAMPLEEAPIANLKELPSTGRYYAVYSRSALLEFVLEFSADRVNGGQKVKDAFYRSAPAKSFTRFEYLGWPPADSAETNLRGRPNQCITDNSGASPLRVSSEALGKNEETATCLKLSPPPLC